MHRVHRWSPQRPPALSCVQPLSLAETQRWRESPAKPQRILIKRPHAFSSRLDDRERHHHSPARWSEDKRSQGATTCKVALHSAGQRLEPAEQEAESQAVVHVRPRVHQADQARPVWLTETLPGQQRTRILRSMVWWMKMMKEPNPRRRVWQAAQ